MIIFNLATVSILQLGCTTQVHKRTPWSGRSAK